MKEKEGKAWEGKERRKYDVEKKGMKFRQRRMRIEEEEEEKRMWEERYERGGNK